MSDDPLFARILRRMAWRHVLPWLVRGLAAGLVVAAALLVAARVLSWPGAAWWAIGAVIACTLVGAGVAWPTRPRPAAALRTADRMLGLRDRLATAWEYAGREAPILRLQRADLAAQAERIDLRRGLPVAPRRRDAALPALGAALLLIAVLLPYPPNHAAAARATTHTHIAHAAQRIAAAQHAAGSLPRSTLAALPKSDRLRQAQIARILTQLQHQLAAARTRAQALKAIAHAQDALNRLANPHAAAQRAALSSLAAALRASAATRPLASALRKSDPAATAAAMHKLAQQLAHLSPKERASLARTMQAAANAAAPDSSLSQSLQNAATALAQGDTAGAQSALGQAGRQAAADQARSAQQAALDQANATLDNARNDVAGLSQQAPPGSTARTAAGKPNGAGQGKGQGTGQGQGRGQGRGQGAGQGQGQGNTPGKGQGQGSGAGQGQGQGQSNGAGTGQGQGRGSGQGQGQGSGNGSGGSGGAGLGGGRGSANGSGHNGAAGGNRVYVPGRQGQGSTTTTNGPQGQATGGSLQPWQSVFPAYERSARAALENGSLPPDQRIIVKKYFDGLSH